MSTERGSWTVDEFCARHSLSKSTYYALKQRGRTPRELIIGRIRRITLAAEAEWLEAVEQPDQHDIESTERRVAAARKAGTLAAASPLHHCRRGAKS
jgi:hypothetical protein